MPWNDAFCLTVARRIEGAIWWGALSALDQWRVGYRPGRPQTSRPTDMELVAAARRDGLSADLVMRFAKEYQLFRNPLNLEDRREERLSAVGTAVREAYYFDGEPGSEDLSGMWWAAIGAVRAAMERFGPTANLKSFCMKTLWLHHPAEATMWDSYAVRALNAQLGAGHTSDIASEREAAAFLADFEQLFARQRILIDEALNDVQVITEERYAYPRRVLDKALWLLGNEDDADVVKQMRLLLERNPSIRAATEGRFGLSPR